VKKICHGLIILPLLLWAHTSYALGNHKKDAILVSIKPLHALLKDITAGTPDKPALLVNKAVSPHDFQLRPSQIKLIYKTEKLIYIDAQQFEHFLNKISKNLTPKTQIPLLKNIEISPLINRPELIWNTAQQSNSKQADPHFWLHPEHTQHATQHIAQQLIKWQPQYRKNYTENTIKLNQKIADQAKQIKEKLSTIKNIPYIVHHDAYQYFEKAYDLKGIAAITQEPEAPYTLKHIYHLKQLIKTQQINCIIADPEANIKKIQNIFPNMQIEILDPIGNQLPTSDTLYFDLINHTAETFLRCLTSLQLERKTPKNN